MLLIPYVFLTILTTLSPASYLISTSGTISLVFPSKTKSLGETEYPFPNEEIPIDSNEDKGDTFIIWGSNVEGLKVWSDGKLYPISLTFAFFGLPIVSLITSTMALDPTEEVIVDIPGRSIYPIPLFVTFAS